MRSQDVLLSTGEQMKAPKQGHSKVLFLFKNSPGYSVDNGLDDGRWERWKQGE